MTIIKELSKTHKCNYYIQTNKKLWEIENKVRLCEKNSDFKEKFIQISRDIYFANDQRSKIKLEINKILGSNIKEVKQYTEY